MDPSPTSPHDPKVTPLPQARPWIPIGISLGVLVLLGLGALMVFRADAKSNKIALTDEPRPVSVIEARGTIYRASRTYVGTLEPWVAANVGPQLVSAYVDTVLVRPGAVVKKGDVIATLDCKTANATSQAVAMQARALETRQKAVANESARVQGLLDGGFVSPNEAEQKEAQSASEQAQLLATQAKLLGTSLEVGDCILRAPFSGEVGTRTADPGAFVRPGVPIVSIVDRSTIRVTADAPEVDFGVISPGTKVTVHVISTGADLVATIARRAPSADSTTRTVHFELDVPDPEKTIPVGTTAEIRIEVGTPAPATVIPLAAASVRGTKVSVFVIEGDIAHLRVVALKGELAGRLYLDPQLPPGARVVTEGRALLNEGDRVAATLEPSAPVTPLAPGSAPTATPSSARATGAL